MRQPIRVVVAAVAAVAALSIAVAATSSAAMPPTPSEHTPSGPGIATCVIQHPDCNDMGSGSSGSARGSPGSGAAAPPPVVGPSPVCGSKHVSASGPDATVATLPCVPGPAPRPQPLIVVPRSGMANVRPIAFSSATVRPDGRTVDIRFWSGVEPCSVLDHVDVAYGTDTVTITLFEGADPTAGMVACPDIAMLKQVTVPLDQELAGRRIVDGAA
jgi:hypothetical protein